MQYKLLLFFDYLDITYYIYLGPRIDNAFPAFV